MRLESYTTEESADDLEALRLALGAEKITLWSISYGTHLALSMIRRHPESVHAAILAGHRTTALALLRDASLDDAAGLLRVGCSPRKR